MAGSRVMRSGRSADGNEADRRTEPNLPGTVTPKKYSLFYSVNQRIEGKLSVKYSFELTFYG
jgi:hypothetical protein